MTSKEFYTAPDGEVMIQSGNAVSTLTPIDTEFINSVDDTIKNFYPEADKALNECYGASNKNVGFFKFLRVRRFIKCNFGNYDNVLDVDQMGRMNFEFVSCPMRGECKYDRIICAPKFNTALSVRELEVMQMCYDGKSDDEIATLLFISLNTVNNHRKNSFKKLGIHSMVDFVRYANDRNLFKN